MINTYELVFILENDTEETQKKITEYLTTAKGTINTAEKWGKKDFAYRLKKQSSGYYFIWRIALDQKKVPDFMKEMDHTEDIMRYLLIKSQARNQKSKTNSNDQNSKS